MYPELRKIECLETAGEYSMLTKALYLYSKDSFCIDPTAYLAHRTIHAAAPAEWTMACNMRAGSLTYLHFLKDKAASKQS